jgi:hypothetical protein
MLPREVDLASHHPRHRETGGDLVSWLSLIDAGKEIATGHEVHDEVVDRKAARA